jgi:tetratricopeptide (TPR) repeat protein
MQPSQTKSMDPAEVLKLVQSGVGNKQLDAITQQVLLINSDSASLNELRLALAEQNRSNNNLGKAAALFRAIANGSTDTTGEKRILEADCLVAGGQAAVALKALELVPQDQQDEPRLLDVKGRALEQLDRTEEAISCYQSVLATGQVRPTTLFLLVHALMGADRHNEAVSVLTNVLSSYPDRADFHYLLSVALHRSGRVDDAEVAVQRAIELDPRSARFFFHGASVLQVLGKIREAEDLANRGLLLEPESPNGLALFGKVHKYETGSAELSRLEKALARLHEVDFSSQLSLLLAKASALEDLKDVPTAFAYYASLGRLKLKQRPNNMQEDNKLLAGMRRAFTPDYVVANRSDRCQSKSPVFVVGMPRSGTSLLEQVMSSHSQIAGIGEQKIISRAVSGMVVNEKFQLANQSQSYWLDATSVSMRDRGDKYLEEAEKVARKVHTKTVDKMPPNYNHLGVIFDILPNAQIIHSMRHPIETCVSCYRIVFGEGHAWSYDLRHLGQQYRRYYELMQFWSQTFEDRILHVRYEDMVDDLETQARRLFDHVSLPFEEQSLNFHENPNPMRTASVLQVRQPLYRTSVDRWRKHRDLLAPLYEEIEDIVELYEKREGMFALAGTRALSA